MKPLIYLFLATQAFGDKLQTANIAKLLDPAQRIEEAARLAECDQKTRMISGCRFLTANQADGEAPLHVLCAAYQFKSITRSDIFGGYETENPEELFGPVASQVPFSTTPDLTPVRDSLLLVFDSTGKEIRPFGGNNYTDEGYFTDFNRDGILERAESTNYGLREAPKHSIEVFHLKTIAAKPVTLLEVAFNWHPDSADDANDWKFFCFDDNNDGFVEIAFGPESATTQEEQRQFVFRWDPSSKTYVTGSIPEKSHIRILKPGETLASIAKSGGLGYPLVQDADDPDPDESPPVIPQSPYVFQSFKDLPDSALAAFFEGKERRDSLGIAEDSFPNRTPENFWEMDPKQAALALAEANRTLKHRADWKLAVDDRGGITPPASGWIIHDWSSSGCYSSSSHLFALRFGVAETSLTVFEGNSIGVVGQNPWADQPASNVRCIPLKPDEARFLADTIFWLDRIRAFSPGKDEDAFSMRSSTADGFATVLLFPDDATPREMASETVWASWISDNWNSGYDRTLFANLTEHLIAHGFTENLGDRWNVAPGIEAQNLATPTNVRLKDRVDNDARQQLEESFSGILKRHSKDPVPAPVLAQLVVTAGEEALSGLLPDLVNLQGTLPPPDDEEKEFDALEKRFANQHLQADPLGDEPRETKEAKERHLQLKEKRQYLPATILRRPLEEAIRQIRLAGKLSDLMNTAAANVPDSRWAITRLLRTDRDSWAVIVADQFRKADLENQRTIFETLAAANPKEAGRLIRDITPERHRELIVEITHYHQQHETTSLPKDIPILMDLVRKKDQDFIRRGEAMSALAAIHLPPDTLKEFTSLLTDEIKKPQEGSYGMTTLDSAVSSLAKLPNAAAHVELIRNQPEVAQNAFEEGFEALLSMTANHPDRLSILAGFLRQRFTNSKGFMNDMFLNALAHDLRSLADDIRNYASVGPDVTDGDGANYSGGHFKTPVGQRYHKAREVTALWSETDPATLARMWIFFALSNPDSFDPQNQYNTYRASLQSLAASKIRALTEDRRTETIDSALKLISSGASIHADSIRDQPVVGWLRQIK